MQASWDRNEAERESTPEPPGLRLYQGCEIVPHEFGRADGDDAEDGQANKDVHQLGASSGACRSEVRREDAYADRQAED